MVFNPGLRATLKIFNDQRRHARQVDADRDLVGGPAGFGPSSVAHPVDRAARQPARKAAAPWVVSAWGIEIRHERLVNARANDFRVGGGDGQTHLFTELVKEPGAQHLGSFRVSSQDACVEVDDEHGASWC